MAQWNRSKRTLFTKIVYYGPAFGGKTTNLESLHRIIDPKGSQPLTSIHTADDRTLFFDLLPFELGEILGYQVAVKVYTVPGQVRYETTRQVVLAGADAIIFVADSSAQREDQNRWSVQNLTMNMRANRLDPAVIPVLFQANKQDLSEAVAPEEVARWLGLRRTQPTPAVATVGRNVLNTFVNACHVMLERLVARADEKTRSSIETGKLNEQIDKAFAPIQARRADDLRSGGAKRIQPPRHSIKVDNDDLLEGAVETSKKLGEKLAGESSRAIRAEKEVAVLRTLNDSLRDVGSNFDRQTNVDAVLSAVAEVLDVSMVSLVHQAAEGLIQLEFGFNGLPDPMIEFEAGRQFLARLFRSGKPAILNDLVNDFCDSGSADSIEGVRAMAVVPIDSSQPTSRMLLAYAPEPDGKFDQNDLRFLKTLASHISVGLEKAVLYAEIRNHRDRLEELVKKRTAQLSAAYADLIRMKQMKERILGNMSHEMRTPLTGILNAAVFLRDYKGKVAERVELAGTIVDSAGKMQGMLDDLFRLINLDDDAEPLQTLETAIDDLLRESALMAGQESLQVTLMEHPGLLLVDGPLVARALASLIDNAIKFSQGDPQVEIRVVEQGIEVTSGTVPGISISVLDRGIGIDPARRETLFSPFDLGGDQLSGKPVGMGIGLYEAREIARKHQGDLLYFPREGGGSEFRLLLPTKPAGLPAGNETGAVATEMRS